VCRICSEHGHVVAATIADHIEPHNGDWNRFLLGELQSFCRDCHARKWATDAKGDKPEIPSRHWRRWMADRDPRHPTGH
jgi:5-methylcytosine-specific restriction protein A